MTPIDWWIVIGGSTASVASSIVSYIAARHALRSANVVLNVQRFMAESRRQRAAQNIQPRVDRPRTATTPAGPAPLNWATHPTDPMPPFDTRTGFRPAPPQPPWQAG